MKRADPVRVIEAAYRHVPDEGEWLAQVLEASGAYDVGTGVIACTVDLGERPRVRAMRTSDDASDAAMPIQSFIEEVPAALGRHLFAPTEFIGNAAWRLNRLSRPNERRAATPAASSRQLPPLWAVVAGDGTRRALMLGYPGPKRGFTANQVFPHRDRRTLGLVGAHLGAALRLRSLLEPEKAPREPSPEGTDEAILAPSGRLLHATGRCRSAAARRSLSDAVVSSERARGRLRRTDASEAAGLWKALVAGQWSVVEMVERDGKRLLLARANPVEAPDLAALTSEERAVVWLVRFGHSYKYVAYELGLSLSAVVRRLGSAMPKMGVSTRAELLRKLSR